METGTPVEKSLKEPSARELRIFAVSISAALFFTLRNLADSGAVLAFPVLPALSGLVFPSLFRPLFGLMRRLMVLFFDAVTIAFTVIVFYIFFTPFAVAARLFGFGSFRAGPVEEGRSGWEKWEPRDGKRDFYRQY